jgi:hypothetical protein
MRQQVTFVFNEPTTHWVPMLDAYKLKPHGRFAWLQRLLWRGLRRFKALEQAHEPKTTYMRHVIDDAEFMRRIFKQRDALFKVSREPTRLLIGSRDYAELMGCPEIHQMFDFRTEYHIESSGRGPRIVGLKVTVVPWMEGLLVLPEGVL